MYVGVGLLLTCKSHCLVTPSSRISDVVLLAHTLCARAGDLEQAPVVGTGVPEAAVLQDKLKDSAPVLTGEESDVVLLKVRVM